MTAGWQKNIGPAFYLYKRKEKHDGKIFYAKYVSGRAGAGDEVGLVDSRWMAVMYLLSTCAGL